MNYLYVGLGAFLGANARYWIANWAAARFGTAFPYGTFIINVTGSFVLGVLVAYLAVRTYSPAWRLFLAVGLCGGYTTFSSYAYETLALLESGSAFLAFLYFVGSPLAAFAAAFVGIVCGRAL
jgi:fluoride exporter